MMKVLLINDYIECGGAELQTRREIENLLNHGNQVLFLSFDSKITCIDNNVNVRVGKTFFSRVYNKLFVNPVIKYKINKILESFKPDYIHINNIFACPITVYNVVKKYKTFQTVRDYGAVCPKSTCIYEDFTECDGFKYNNCRECIKNMSFKAKFKNYSFNKINKIKFIAIKKFICPSEALTDKCKRNGYNITCINNPFDFTKEYVVEKILKEKKVYLYYGMIEEVKGVFKLIEAFDLFATGKNVELHFVGKIKAEDEHRFIDSIQNKDYIRYYGYMKNEDILKKLNEIYCVVVPSLWIENYPNTVLEPMANKTLVIGSNRGGIRGMIQNDDLLFDILKIDDLISKLNYTYTMNEALYFDIVMSNYRKIKENNTIEKYYSSLINTFYDEK